MLGGLRLIGRVVSARRRRGVRNCAGKNPSRSCARCGTGRLRISRAARSAMRFAIKRDHTSWNISAAAPALRTWRSRYRYRGALWRAYSAVKAHRDHRRGNAASTSRRRRTSSMARAYARFGGANGRAASRARCAAQQVLDERSLASKIFSARCLHVPVLYVTISPSHRNTSMTNEDPNIQGDAP